MVTKTRTITIGYADTSNGTYTPIADIIDLPGGPEVSVDSVDTTVSDSASEAREKVPGWKSVADMTLKIRFAKAAQATLFALVGTAKYFKITYSEGSTWIFYGFINKYGNSTDMAGIITADIGIAVSGLPTFTAAT